MFWRSKSLLQNCQDPGLIAANEGGGIEPKARERFAAKNSCRIGQKRLKGAAASDEPI